jgi:hypothetical protein
MHCFVNGATLRPLGVAPSRGLTRLRSVFSVNNCNDLNNLSSSERMRWKTRAEGRRHERVQLIMPLLIINHAVTGDLCDQGVSVDVSESGVAFETEANLSSWNLVELVFDANEESEYRRYARLIYRCGPRYGAYFTKLD